MKRDREIPIIFYYSLIHLDNICKLCNIYQSLSKHATITILYIYLYILRHHPTSTNHTRYVLQI